jgi:hypothetical protein
MYAKVACICRLWVALYMYAMGDPVYACYAWPCICILCFCLFLFLFLFCFYLFIFYFVVYY